MKKLVILSGGQDSTTCLALAIGEVGVENVHTITFDYGQRHRAEVEAAVTIAIEAGILVANFEVLRIPGILKGSSPLVNKATAVDQYADAASLPGGLEKTFVPMRNTLFLTLAANRAVLLAASAGEEVAVVTGVSQEDYGGYPDCRIEFIALMENLINASLADPLLPEIIIETPLINLTKKATVELSEKIGARWLIAHSHTCYNGGVPPCGKCHACLLRQKGYDEAGVTDPLIERMRAEGRYDLSAAPRMV